MQPIGDMLDVVILGAGMAGLAGASTLASRGLKICVLEARDRIGGRVATHRTDESDIPIELGAEFVHGEAESVTRIAHEGRVALVEMEGEHWGLKDGALGIRTGSWEAMGRMMEKVGRLVTPERDLPFAEALAKVDGPDDARAMAIGFVEGFEASDSNRISAYAVTHAGDETDRSRRVVSGYDRIAETLRARIPPDSLRLGTIVKRVVWSQGKVRVETPAQTFHARTAIVTLPVGVLQHGDVAFEPPLDGKKGALSKVAMGTVSRISFVFREAFWLREAKVREGCDPNEMSFIHGPDSQFPTWWTQHPLDVPMLTAWAGGPKARKISELPDAEVVRRALDALSTLFGVDRARIEQQLVGSYRHDWTTDPFSRGAYTYPLAGGARAWKELARPLDRTLFFAGEATSEEHYGTTHGAIDTGERAAREVILVLGTRAETLAHR